MGAGVAGCARAGLAFGSRAAQVRKPPTSASAGAENRMKKREQAETEDKNPRSSPLRYLMGVSCLDILSHLCGRDFESPGPNRRLRLG